MFTLYRLPASDYTLGTRVTLIILVGFAVDAKGPEVPVLILYMLRCFSPYVSHVVPSLMKRFFCAHGALIALTLHAIHRMVTCDVKFASLHCLM